MLANNCWNRNVLSRLRRGGIAEEVVTQYLLYWLMQHYSLVLLIHRHHPPKSTWNQAYHSPDTILPTTVHFIGIYVLIKG